MTTLNGEEMETPLLQSKLYWSQYELKHFSLNSFKIYIYWIIFRFFYVKNSLSFFFAKEWQEKDLGQSLYLNETQLRTQLNLVSYERAIKRPSGEVCLL